MNATEQYQDWLKVQINETVREINQLDTRLAAFRLALDNHERIVEAEKKNPKPTVID